MSQDVQTQPGAVTAPADEHLAHLHKMSTTAGVTNQDYVAVNPLAVVAATLGVTSGLAFFGWLLLVIPIVGIIFAIVAVRQIGDSNGTQTGRGLAILGLALCLLCAGGMMVQRYREHAAVRGDEQGIAAAISEFGQSLKAGDYTQAYGRVDDAFKDNVPFDVFGQLWERIAQSVGRVEILEWNGVTPDFQSSAGSPTAGIKAKLKFQRGEEERIDVLLRKVGDKWLINALPQFFKGRPPRSPHQRDDVFSDPRLD
jgi:hypothetical protein